MCGIAGLLDSRQRLSESSMLAAAERMADTLYHRGPDHRGVWTDPERGLAFGFSRLAILDLSPEGHQPMHSADGRYTMVFNGEVYNHPELRRDLEGRGHAFRGHSDTEVVLAAFVEWGVHEALTRFNGMFAIGVWDHDARRLYLARDRLGKKPLYYGWAGDTLMFASELKALRVHPDFRAKVDRGALALFFAYGYIPAPHTIYANTFKLPPASVAEFSAHGRSESIRRYWSLEDVARDGIANRFRGTEDEALGVLDGLLRDAVRSRMIADVPLGAFLSSGSDSSLIVALMQAESQRPIKTFTVGFSESEFDEAPLAREVARYLGTDHTEMYVTPAETWAVIPEIPRIYDEPFADSSQIPTFLISELARRRVTVSLSGDGGDELFGGYGRYFLAQRAWSTIKLIPRVARAGAASALVTTASLAGRVSPLPSRAQRASGWSERGQRAAAMLTANGPEELYDEILSHFRDPAEIVIADNGAPSTASARGGRFLPGPVPYIENMMYRDAAVYLPDDILVKVDRASMSVSLEVRAPLLDYRVAEFAWSLPLDMKVRGGQGKWLPRRLLSNLLPRELVERPKRGFDVPVADWLRDPLREWAESLLSERRLREEGFLRATPIRAMWTDHLRGRRNWQHALWSVLMFQSWLEEHSAGRATA